MLVTSAAPWSFHRSIRVIRCGFRVIRVLLLLFRVTA